MKRNVLVLATLLLVLNAGSAFAQARRASPQRTSYLRMTHRLEIGGYYGYVWTGSRAVQFIDEDNRVGYADVDIEDSAMWGIEIDIPTRPDAQIVLLYNRQESEVTLKEGRTTETVGDVLVEYWHVGGLGGIPQGNLMPYSILTLGGTRYSALNGVSGDTWKFSMIFGLGVKMYVNDRIALRVQGRVPYTFFSGSLGLGIGTGGVSVVAGGTGIIQGDLSAGISLLI